jgi:hypothetical protein
MFGKHELSALRFIVYPYCVRSTGSCDHWTVLYYEYYKHANSPAASHWVLVSSRLYRPFLFHRFQSPHPHGRFGAGFMLTYWPVQWICVSVFTRWKVAVNQVPPSHRMLVRSHITWLQRVLQVLPLIPCDKRRISRTVVFIQYQPAHLFLGLLTL